MTRARREESSRESEIGAFGRVKARVRFASIVEMVEMMPMAVNSVHSAAIKGAAFGSPCLISSLASRGRWRDFAGVA